MGKHITNSYKSKGVYSQKIARVFMVFGIIMLIPAISTLFVALILLVVNSTWEVLLIFFIMVFGFVLFAGYVLHSRGNMKPNTVMWLWIGTIIFNGVPLIFMLNRAFAFLINSQQELDYGFIFVFSCLSAVWLTAFILATSALVSSIKEN